MIVGLNQSDFLRLTDAEKHLKVTQGLISILPQECKVFLMPDGSFRLWTQITSWCCDAEVIMDHCLAVKNAIVNVEEKERPADIDKEILDCISSSVCEIGCDCKCKISVGLAKPDKRRVGLHCVPKKQFNSFMTLEQTKRWYFSNEEYYEREQIERFMKRALMSPIK